MASSWLELSPERYAAYVETISPFPTTAGLALNSMVDVKHGPKTQKAFSLAVGIATLPPEIYEITYNYTFTKIQYSMVNITTGYRPPSILQVDRSSRSLALRSYYQNTTFILQLSGAQSGGQGAWWLASTVPPPGERWLRRLPSAHRGLLRQVIIVNTARTAAPVSMTSGRVNMVEELDARDALEQFSFRELGLNPKVLSVSSGRLDSGTRVLKVSVGLNGGGKQSTY